MSEWGLFQTCSRTYYENNSQNYFRCADTASCRVSSSTICADDIVVYILLTITVMDVAIAAAIVYLVMPVPAVQ